MDPPCLRYGSPPGTSLSTTFPFLAQEVFELVHELLRVKVIVTPGARPRCLIEGTQIRLDKPLASTRHWGNPHIQRGRNSLIAQPVRRFEQNARPR